MMDATDGTNETPEARFFLAFFQNGRLSAPSARLQRPVTAGASADAFIRSARS